MEATQIIKLNGKLPRVVWHGFRVRLKHLTLAEAHTLFHTLFASTNRV